MSESTAGIMDWIKRSLAWLSTRIGWALWYVAIVIAVTLLIWGLQQGLVQKPDKVSLIVWSAVVLVVVGTLFVHIFTNDMGATHQKEPPRSWFVFSYSFMLVALALAIIPFFQDWTDATNDSYSNRPIAVFRGCVQGTPGTVPGELLCQKDSTIVGRGIGAGTEFAKPSGMWIINLGGIRDNSTACGTNCYGVRGGMVVPLYVVILALFGGAVSLTRRVPEYQKQSEPQFNQVEANQPKLQLAEVREYLVFQIVQYISAPFIAVVAYYVVKPDETTTSVAIAFVAGFASETILLMIRSVVEKVTPTVLKVSAGGSITVYVEDSHSGQPASGVEVRIVGHPNLRAATRADGSDVFEDVPAGVQTVEVKYNNNVKTHDVNVERGRASACQIKV